jgi:hypothetical protein
LIFFSLNGCFIIQIQEGVDYPSQIFKQAQDEIKKIQIKYSKKNVRAHKMNILVYDGESRDLVRISLPIWLVNLGLKTGLKYAEHDVAKTSSHYIDIDWEKLQNLSELEPGLLVEVEDLEEKSHVLIWLR